MLAITQFSGFGLGEWTPARLRPALWIDGFDASTLRQEITGASATTPCVVGDPVGTVRNKGTLGGWFVAPNTGSRPTLEAGGALRFNGSALSLAAPALSVGTFETLIAAEEFANNGFAGLLSLAPNSGDDFTNASAFAFSLSGNTNREITFAANNTFTLDIGAASLMPARVLNARRDGTTTVTVAYNLTEQSAAYTMTGTHAGAAVVGARFLGGVIASGSRLNGRIWQLVHTGRVLAAGEREIARRWMARRAGVTL
jgi:hypothetical protein